MSLSPVTIPSRPSSKKSLNFGLLREEGIGYIQRIASATWTDHNLHDPGITILEALCYAITELGYRTEPEAKDLFFREDSGGIKDFFTAAETLSCHPLTVQDYRKVLLDQPFVRNAWLELADNTEPAVFFDKNALTQPLNFANKGELVIWNGLYEVLVEFMPESLAPGEAVEDLNSNVVEKSIVIAGKTYLVGIALPYGDDPRMSEWSQTLTISAVTLTSSPPLKQTGSGFNWFAKLSVTHNAGTDEFGITILSNNTFKESVLPQLEAAIISALQDSGPNGVAARYNRRLVKVAQYFATLRPLLCNLRNLCEDFYSFKAVRIQEIALTADLEAAPGSDPVDVLANIFYKIDRFLSVSLRFTSLEAALSAGKTSEEIWDGPLLQNGFLDSKELGGASPDVVYISDLVRIIMDQDGDGIADVIAGVPVSSRALLTIRDIALSSYLNNLLIFENMRNTLGLAQVKYNKPRLSIAKSNVRFFREKLEIPVNLEAAIVKFNQLKNQDSPTSALPALQSDPFAIPTGQVLDFNSYQSVRDELPLAYGVRDTALPDSASAARKANAKQLQGYLVFFDQFLANYLAQLKHAKAVLSVGNTNAQTYFQQIPATISTLSGSVLNAGYPGAVGNLSVAPEQGADRRKRTLDHLLARFAEDFSETAAMLYTQNPKPTEAQVLAKQSNFLQAFPTIARDRSRAYCYTSAPAWDTDKVSGLEQKLYHLFGFQGARRQRLCDAVFSFIQTPGPPASGLMGFLLRRVGGFDLLKSLTNTLTIADFERLTNEVVANGYLTERYKIISLPGNLFGFRLSDEAGVEIAESVQTFPDIIQANTAPVGSIQDVITQIKFYLPKDGFHMVEHILLRPFSTDNSPATPVLFTFNEQEKPVKDPWSFRISFVFPDFGPTFSDPKFRLFAEKTIYAETPAHIIPRIAWVPRAALVNSEAILQGWYQTKSNPLSSTQQLQNTLSGIVQHLFLPQFLGKYFND